MRLIILGPNAKLTDRRWNRVLAANPGSDHPEHPKRRRGAAVRVERLVRLSYPPSSAGVSD
jgi:hypothetical protein